MRCIQVAKEIDAICVTIEDADRLRQLIEEAFADGEEVRLDFVGVKVLVTAFLNAAIGRLLETYSKADLLGRLTWSGLDELDDQLIRIVIKRAATFYSLPSESRDELIESYARRINE